MADDRLDWATVETGDVVVRADGRRFRAGVEDGWRTWEPVADGEI